jgi:hypothetical protein
MTSLSVQVSEAEVLDLLAHATRSVTWDGRIRWHLGAADICCLLELAGLDREGSDQLYQILQRW